MGPWKFVILNSGVIDLGHTDKADERSKKDYTGREGQTPADCLSLIKSVAETAQI